MGTSTRSSIESMDGYSIARRTRLSLPRSVTRKGDNVTVILSKAWVKMMCRKLEAQSLEIRALRNQLNHERSNAQVLHSGSDGTANRTICRECGLDSMRGHTCMRNR